MMPNKEHEIDTKAFIVAVICLTANGPNASQPLQRDSRYTARVTTTARNKQREWIPDNHYKGQE